MRKLLAESDSDDTEAMDHSAHAMEEPVADPHAGHSMHESHDMPPAHDHSTMEQE